jgi:hypothetical protein
MIAPSLTRFWLEVLESIWRKCLLFPRLFACLALTALVLASLFPMMSVLTGQLVSYIEGGESKKAAFAV